MVCVLLDSQDKNPIDLFAGEEGGQNTQMRENALAWAEELALKRSIHACFSAVESSPFCKPLHTYLRDGERRSKRQAT